jgi:integrase
MGNKATELGALAVKNITRRGTTFVGGVPGLALVVHGGGSKSWILRYKIGGVRRDMGLGSYEDVSLASAREKARTARARIEAGTDPIQERKTARSALIAEMAKALTFSECAAQYIATHEAGWRNAKHAQQWRSTIESYANPVIGQLLVRDVALPHILKVLEPIWHTKTETASRLRGRIESVLDWATAREYRTGSNPAQWKGRLDTLLAGPSKITKTNHHRALPYADMPDFMATLREQSGTGAKALEFTILTAARSGEVRGAKWAEFDLTSGVWTVPAERMKAGKEHRVPLSKAALNLLNEQKAVSVNQYVFPSPRATVMSDMTLSAVLRRMKVDAVPHGFRSTFRDWAAEKTDYPNEMAEMALAHTIGDKVEAAYRRGDLLDKRKKMMQDWANFCEKPCCTSVATLDVQ